MARREADTLVQRLAALFETTSKATVLDDDPETIRRVLQMLIESGAAALPAPTDDERQQPREQETTGWAMTT